MAKTSFAGFVISAVVVVSLGYVGYIMANEQHRTNAENTKQRALIPQVLEQPISNARIKYSQIESIDYDYAADAGEIEFVYSEVLLKESRGRAEANRLMNQLKKRYRLSFTRLKTPAKLTYRIRFQQKL